MVVLPGTVTVIVPIRCVPVFAEAVILNEPLPVRFTGDIFEIVNQFTLLLGIFHVPFDVTVILVQFPWLAGRHALADKVSESGAACVTVIVRVGAPGADTVIVPVLCPPVFAVALILNEPLPFLVAGVIFVMVSQFTLLLGTFHILFDVTLIVALP
jgi:hypothetical protein